MSPQQQQELYTLRAKARGEASDAALISELLDVAGTLRRLDQHHAADTIHRAVVRIEGHDADGWSA